MNQKEIINKIEIVLELLERKSKKFPDSAIIRMLTEKYARAKQDAESGQAELVHLLGGSRAYLDAFSDWQDNPLLDAMGAVEREMKAR